MEAGLGILALLHPTSCVHASSASWGPDLGPQEPSMYYAECVSKCLLSKRVHIKCVCVCCEGEYTLSAHVEDECVGVCVHMCEHGCQLENVYEELEP